MCKFKYCRGTGTCFLSKTSPCAGFVSSSNSKGRPRSIRMRYEGFLDQDMLLDVLEHSDAQDHAKDKPVENPKGLSGLVSAAPRFLRRKTDKIPGQEPTTA